MTSVWSLLVVEARKQARLKLPYIGVVGLVVMALVYAQAMDYYTDSPTPSTGYEFVANTMTAMSTMLIPIFTVIFAATLVASETGQGTLRFVLCRPFSRLSFVCAKFLAGFAYATLQIVVGAAAIAVVGAVFIGYGTQRDLLLGVELPAGAFWGSYAAACAFTALPMFTTAAFGLWLSILFRNAGAAVGVAAGSLVMLEPLKNLITLELLGRLLPLRPVLAFIDYLDGYGVRALKDFVWTNYYDTALDLVGRLAKGAPDPWNQPDVWWALAVSSIWLAVFGGLSFVVIHRRDWG